MRITQEDFDTLLSPEELNEFAEALCTAEVVGLTPELGKKEYSTFSNSALDFIKHSKLVIRGRKIERISAKIVKKTLGDHKELMLDVIEESSDIIKAYEQAKFLLEDMKKYLDNSIKNNDYSKLPLIHGLFHTIQALDLNSFFQETVNHDIRMAEASGFHYCPPEYQKYKNDDYLIVMNKIVEKIKPKANKSKNTK